MALKADRNRWACRTDLKRFIARSPGRLSATHGADDERFAAGVGYRRRRLPLSNAPSWSSRQTRGTYRRPLHSFT